MAYVGPFRDGWRAQIQKDGVRVSKTFRLKRDAQAWAMAQDSKKTLHSRSFKALAEKYLDEVSAKKHGAVYEGRLIPKFVAHFGDVDLTEIDAPQIGAWRDSRLKTVLASTVLREVNVLRHMFKVARDEWRWIEHNPFRGVKLPKESAPRTAVWTWPLIKRVLRAPRVGKTREMQAAFHIALRTGMRLQEVLGAPAAFDAKAKVVRLKTKTEAMATIPIGRLAAKLIAGQVFTVGANEGSVLFSKLCRELLIEGLTFHDARATALTHLAKKVDVLTLAKISRHKNISLLSNVYYRETASQIAARI